MRRLAIVSLLSLGVAAALVPASAMADERGFEYGYGSPYGYGYGPGVGAAHVGGYRGGPRAPATGYGSYGRVPAGFAVLGVAGAVDAGVASRGYDYTDSYVRTDYGSEPGYGPGAGAYEPGPEPYGVTSGWYGY